MRLSPGGQFSVVAGSQSSNVTSGDGGPASQATFVQPNRLAVGPDGAIYVADGGGLRVRRIGSDGIITTVAGTGVVNTTPHSGDGGPATAAQIDPFSIAVARDNTLYIGDHFSQGYYLASVRAVRNGTIETVAGQRHPLLRQLEASKADQIAHFVGPRRGARRQSGSERQL